MAAFAANRDSVNQWVTRRDFCKLCGLGLGIFSHALLFGLPEEARGQMAKKGYIRTRVSPYFTRLDKGAIRCDLCPFRCVVARGERGLCRVRENRGGKHVSLVYGNPCAANLDPIEKKPFYHVIPGSGSFSIATVGCNFRCKFCQNWEISQAAPEEVYNLDLPPELVIKRARDVKARSIAYSFTEPTIFYEYVQDTALLAKKAGILNVYHSNGYINPEPLRRLCPVLDGANIDLKGFSGDFYRQMCEGTLGPVLETLKILKEQKVHLEITHLVIPTKNDDLNQVRDMCLWIIKELGPDTPIHFSRFYPLYKLKGLPPTPVATMDKVRQTAQAAGLNYVYIGNIPGHEGENTFCPNCKRLIIKRTGFMVGEVRLKNGRCEYCQRPIPGIWE